MMTYDQARSLEVGDELIHDTGIKRKVVKYNEGKRHIWLKPRLVGKGKAASMSQTQLIAHHSLHSRAKHRLLAVAWRTRRRIRQDLGIIYLTPP